MSNNNDEKKVDGKKSANSPENAAANDSRRSEASADDELKAAEGQDPEATGEEKVKAEDQVSEEKANRIYEELHKMGLTIGIAMFVFTAILVGVVCYTISEIYNDILYQTIDYDTLDLINNGTSWTLLALVTLNVGFMLVSLVRNESPFTTSNTLRIRIIAVTMVLLSFLPMAFEFFAAVGMGMSMTFSVNLVYIFVGGIFICLSVIFDYGRVIKSQLEQTIETDEQILLTLAEMIEVKSTHTGQHVKRISEYSRIIGEALGMSKSRAENLRLASMLHDVGKLLIPNSILEKEGLLSDEEYEIMKSHVTIGEQLLQNTEGEVMDEAKAIALQHHEKWDGSGYLGMKGDEIDLSARIVAVADTFDSLVSERGYKKGWESNKVYSQVVDESGKRFDPKVIDAFVTNYGKLMDIYNKYNRNSIASAIPEASRFNEEKQQATARNNNAGTGESLSELDLRYLI